MRMGQSTDEDWDIDKARLFIATLYKTILGREADAEGLESYANRVATGSMTGEDVISELMTSDEAAKRYAGMMPIVFGGIVKGLTGRDATAVEYNGFTSMEPTVEGVADLVRAVIDKTSSDDDWYRRLVAQRGLIRILVDELDAENRHGSKSEGGKGV